MVSVACSLSYIFAFFNNNNSNVSSFSWLVLVHAGQTPQFLSDTGNLLLQCRTLMEGPRMSPRSCIFLLMLGTFSIFADNEESTKHPERFLFEPNTNCSEVCGVGACVKTTEFSLGSCLCIKPYIDMGNRRCVYPAKSKLVAFLLSFLVGGMGVDWFYLSGGHASYIVAGILKLLTFGGLGVWWLTDWIRILCDSFYDGAGNSLYQDLWLLLFLLWNTSLAAKVALAHHMQHRTACNTSLPAYFKMAVGFWK